jgi:hypothetical protein
MKGDELAKRREDASTSTPVCEHPQRSQNANVGASSATASLASATLGAPVATI